MEKINHKDKLNVDFSCLKQSLQCFPTKKLAVEAGKQYGWSDAVKLEDRFEYCWVPGRKMFQDSYAGDVAREHFMLPMLRWDKNNGVEFCPVVNVYRIKKNN